jgi:hypothetical protein
MGRGEEGSKRASAHTDTKEPAINRARPIMGIRVAASCGSRTNMVA